MSPALRRMARIVRWAGLLIILLLIGLNTINPVFYYATPRWWFSIGSGSVLIDRGWHTPGSGWRAYHPGEDEVSLLVIAAALAVPVGLLFLSELAWLCGRRTFCRGAVSIVSGTYASSWVGDYVRLLHPAGASLWWPANLTIEAGFACTVAVVLYVAVFRQVRGAETRCRQCRHILRGLAEPSCPNCGERI